MHMKKNYVYYLGQSDDAIKNPFLLNCEKVQIENGDKHIFHSHAFTEIFVIESGKGFFECGKRSQNFIENDIIMVKSGVKHTFYTLDEPIIYYSYAVTDLFGGELNFPSTTGYLYLSGEKTKRILEINALCQAELNGNKNYKISAVSSYLKLIITEILRSCDSDIVKVNNLDEIKEYLQKHYAEDITLDGLCKVFFTNKNTLLHAFKKSNGTSPLNYLNLYRVEKAKQKLSRGASVTETAFAVGFYNAVYFAEVFKKVTGLTPSAFKKWANMIEKDV